MPVIGPSVPPPQPTVPNSVMRQMTVHGSLARATYTMLAAAPPPNTLDDQNTICRRSLKASDPGRWVAGISAARLQRAVNAGQREVALMRRSDRLGELSIIHTASRASSNARPVASAPAGSGAG